MMEIGEEVRENCHVKLLNANAEFLTTMSRKSAQNSIKFLNENKQNIVDFGAEIATATTKTQTLVTMQQINRTEMEMVTAATTCTVGQEVKLNDVPIVPELDTTPINNKRNSEKSESAIVENAEEESSQESLANQLDGSGETDQDFDQGEEEEEEDEDDEPDNTDDSSSDDSDFSDLSGMSDESGREWKPITKPINWVQKQIHSGANPRELLSQMLPNSGQIAPGLNDMTLWRILASMLSEPPRRQKLRYINTFADVIQLVREAKNIIVLTGAGVSVSCGIPDFRSSDGIYSRLAKDFPDLPDPQAMFDINYFSRDPRPFYKFAREIYPGQFKPSPCHSFVKLLESKHKLLRNYTQNIDTLEQVAGIKNVIECHGSFSTASCTKCKLKTTADAIRDDIFVQRIPVCPRCQPNVHQSVDASEPVSELELRQIVENGIMKPDIVFFGEGLPEKFHTVMASDKDKCDLLIVMGSSLKVRPVALIPSSIPANVPQILINREQLHHLEFDVELLGDSDVIINQLCHHLGDEWKQICFDDKVLTETTELLPVFEEEEENNTVTEDDPLRLDNDTQSVKSNASTDFALRSAGGYSDSGFESSTSSGVVADKLAVNVNSDTDIEATEAIQKIKSSILELSSETKTKKSVELLSPDLLGDNMDTVDFENPTFHPTNLPDSYRHLSIDSSKDSGIQCNDSSNSATATNGAGALQPRLTNFGNRGDTVIHTQVSIESVSAPATPTKQLNAAAPEITTQHKMTGLDSTEECKIKMEHPQKNLSAADRLLDGTYYCHESSSSYVFPGAQVSWYTDSEEEEDDDNFRDDGGGGDRNENVGNEEETADSQAISPILPPSIEAEMVSEITARTETVATTSVMSFKRKSNDKYDETFIQTQSETLIISNNKDLLRRTNTTATTPTLCSPPMKKRRNSNEEDGEKEDVRLQNANSVKTDILKTLLPTSDDTKETTAIELKETMNISSSQNILLQLEQL